MTFNRKKTKAATRSKRKKKNRTNPNKVIKKVKTWLQQLKV